MSGSGVFVFNQIGSDVDSYILGSPGDGDTEIIEAGSISLYASDDSVINTVAGAASAAIAVGQTGVGVSIGAAVAVNEISTSVDANITHMGDGLTADASEVINLLGDTRIIGISRSGRSKCKDQCRQFGRVHRHGFGQGSGGVGCGASATNYILTGTNASIENSTILNADSIDIDAVNTSTIKAVVVAASAAIGGGQWAWGLHRRIAFPQPDRLPAGQRRSDHI